MGKLGDIFKTMFLDENIVSILAIAFFIICIISITHVFFSVPDRVVRRAICIYPSIYAIFFSVIEMNGYKNIPNLETISNRVIGGVLGCIAGYYFGYQFCILIKLIDDTSFMKSTESSDMDNNVLTAASHSTDIANAVSTGFSIAGRELGSFLGEVLFPT